MNRVLGMTLLLIGASTFAFATYAVPEIDPGSGASALALISGALLIARDRRKK
jgi:hypothetical protein